MGLFSSRDNTFLGIDIGDNTIKMVELSKKGKKISLSNYAFSSPIENFKFSHSDDIDNIAKAIVRIKNEAGIKTNKASASLPSFSVFSSVININNYDKRKINERIIEEAKKVIPLPISEMVLDWKIIPDKGNPGGARVFLTGSPKKLVKKYIEIFKRANIFLSNLETETFSMIRALTGNDPSTVMFVGMGANSTNFSIVKESIPFLNRSINISGKTVTSEIAKRLNISLEAAEQFKTDLAFSDESDPESSKIISDIITPIVKEIRYMLDLFNSSNKERVEKIILSGGGSLLPNFAQLLEDSLDIKVIIGDPWFRVSYPPELKPVLDEVGPRLSVALGLALRGLE